MIFIKNRQRTIAVDLKQLESDALYILALIGYPYFDINILLTTNRTIRFYNRTYRNKDRATDILSFAYYDLKPGQKITVQDKEDENLGDLIISLAYVQKDAPKWGQTLQERMRILLIHGICHLLGYDHELDKDYKIMKKKEDFLLQELKKRDMKTGNPL